MGNITKIFGVAEKAAAKLEKEYPSLLRVGGTFTGAANLLLQASNWLKQNGHDHSVEKTS